MTLHLAKGRRALVYTFPMPQIGAGTTWEAEFPVWGEDGTPADLTGATIYARIHSNHRDDVLATATTTVLPGLIRWSFPASSLRDAASEMCRFTVDVSFPDGTAQRLIDSALPVRGSSYRRRDDYGSPSGGVTPPGAVEVRTVSGAQATRDTTQTSSIAVVAPPGTNPAPWDAVTTWTLPVLTDPDVGKRIATGSLLLPSSITTEAWNGPESHYNPKWRDDANRQIFIYDPGQTFSGYDMRGWSVFVTGNADNTTIRDCLFDSNSKSGSSQLWWGAVYSFEGAAGLAVEYCDFIGDKVMNAGRGHAFIRAADNPEPMKRIFRCKFMQASNDAVEVCGVTDGITHNYFYGMGYQDESHSDCITVARTFCPTVIEYNHFDSYGDGDFGTQVDPIIASTQSNSVALTATSGANLLGVTCRFNTHKGGAFQVEPNLHATCKGFVFHNEYRLLRWGPPHYPVNRSAKENYQGPWGDIDRATFGTVPATDLRYYNQIEVDFDGAGNDRALGSINAP
jgi:hypothetical protein